MELNDVVHQHHPHHAAAALDPSLDPSRRVYVGRILITLPNALQSTVELNIRLNEPGALDSAREVVVPLQAKDVIVHQYTDAQINSIVAESVKALGPHGHQPPALGSMLPDRSRSVGSHDLSTPTGPVASSSSTYPSLPAPTTAMSLPAIPMDRLTAPISRTSEEEAQVKEYVMNALKNARQWSGSRPSPLVQIDRFLLRVELFCNLHRLGKWIVAPGTNSNSSGGDNDLVVYWNDLLKFGGLGSAWNEKKARRPYKHIYADLVTHQNNPLIRPFLEGERGKTLDDLEIAFDTVLGREPRQDQPGLSLARYKATPAVMAPSENGRGDDETAQELLEPADAEPAAKKRKRNTNADPVPAFSAPMPGLAPFAVEENVQRFMEPLPPVPTVRISHPSTRSAEEEEEVKQHIIASLVAAGQWSGSRPAVLTSAQHFITRMRLLTKLHADSDTSSGPDVYWDDCIKNGGMAQAWASKKAGRSAYRTTYNELLRHQNNAAIVNLLTSPSATDIKTVEIVLASLNEKGGSPTPAPPAASTSTSTAMPAAPSPMLPSLLPTIGPRLPTPLSESPIDRNHHSFDLPNDVDEDELLNNRDSGEDDLYGD